MDFHIKKYDPNDMNGRECYKTVKKKDNKDNNLFPNDSFDNLYFEVIKVKNTSAESGWEIKITEYYDRPKPRDPRFQKLLKDCETEQNGIH